jgi:hypothetical protein
MGVRPVTRLTKALGLLAESSIDPSRYIRAPSVQDMYRSKPKQISASDFDMVEVVDEVVIAL